jgi:hypothetical protein
MIIRRLLCSKELYRNRKPFWDELISVCIMPFTTTSRERSIWIYMDDRLAFWFTRGSGCKRHQSSEVQCVIKRPMTFVHREYPVVERGRSGVAPAAVDERPFWGMRHARWDESLK